MKKIILSLVGLVCGVSVSMAQTNVITAQNLPTPSGQGFEYKFLGTAADNCSAGSVWNCFLVPGTPNGYTTGWSGSNPIVQATASASGLYSFRLPVGNCGIVQSPTYPVDLTSNLKLKITLSSDVAVPKFGIMFGFDNSGYVAADGHATDVLPVSALT